MTHRTLVRIERSRAGLARLGEEVRGWLEGRLARDSMGQYRTQLGSLRGILDQALSALGARVDGVSSTDGAGRVYEACSEIDRAVAWVRRVWEYYRERFDQRDDPRWAPVLRAADEVVWSCYAEPMRIGAGVGAGGAVGAAPLPFIDEVIAPEAALRQEPPRSLELPRGVAPAVQEEMDAFLRAMPIPTVALPAECAEQPWWLAVLGHEVGHSVLADLSSGAVGEFGGALESAAATHLDGAYTPADSALWRRWAHEVFADAFFAMVMGEAGWVAVVELETAPTDTMRARRIRYPPARARLAFVGALSGVTPADPPSPGEDEEDADGRSDPDTLAAAHLAGVVPSIALTAPAGPTSLRELARWDPAGLGSSIGGWRDGLRGRATFVPRREADAARKVAAAGLLAWREVTSLPEPVERREAAEALKEVLLDGLPRCREDGVRAAGRVDDRGTAELGARLAGLGLAHAGGSSG